MAITDRFRKTSTTAAAIDPADLKPLPAWYFGFEGVMGSAYDLAHVWHGAWMLVVALGAANALISLTVLGRRRKLVRAMLKNARTRRIAVALIVLRAGVHMLLGAIGTQVTSAPGHLALAVVMGAVTVALLWYDQRVTFRTLAAAEPGQAPTQTPGQTPAQAPAA
jgi:hypothetical protein